MRILFLSHYFPPEVNAPATRTYEHCVRWAEAGHEVTVVTCNPNCPDGVLFPGYRNRFRRKIETVDDIRVIRVWTYLAPNAGTARRILNYVSYMCAATWTCLWMRRPDIVIATSPQFFCGWGGVLVSKLRRIPFVLEIRDIWPESIEAVGALKNPRLLRLLEKLERWMYRAASHIVAVGDGYRDNIQKKVDVAGRCTVITNGVDLAAFDPTLSGAALDQRWSLSDKFTCFYIGTIGMAHGLQVVNEAARLLRERGRSDVCFCIVGDGAQRAQLQKETEELGLEDMVKYFGRVTKEEVPAHLARADACLIHLRGTDLFATVIPSKIFETMAMQCPIIMGVAGQSREIVLEAEAAIPMEPDSAESLVDAVERLADDPQLCASLGKNGRQFVAENYDRNRSAKEYLDLLKRVASKADSRKFQRGRLNATGNEHSSIESPTEKLAAPHSFPRPRWFYLLRYHRPGQLIRRLRNVCRHRWLAKFGAARYGESYVTAPSLRGNKAFGNMLSTRLADRRSRGAQQVAERVEFGKICFLNQPVSFPGRIDWRVSGHPELDSLWRFHLHYHEYLLDLIAADDSDTKTDYQWLSWKIVGGWIEKNQPSDGSVFGDAWHPYCISRRLPVWILLWTAAPPPADQQERVLKSIVGQANFLADHLETDLGGNHLLENLRALGMAACFLAGPDADRWLAIVNRLLPRELDEQITPHGEHFERSPMYHAHMLEAVLDLRDAATTVNASIAACAAGAATRMAEFLQKILHPDLEIPLLGDSWLGEAPPPSTLLKRADVPQTVQTTSTVVGHTTNNIAKQPTISVADQKLTTSVGGYWTFRDGEDFLIFDAAPACPDHLPAHAHADLLNIEASISRQRVFVDSGVYTYEAGTMRQYCRGTSAHNVLQVDGADQFDMWSRFRMGYRGWTASLDPSQSQGQGEVFSWTGAFHNAYRRLGVPYLCRWLACRSGGPWICVDWAEGDGRHELTNRLHLHPDVETTQAADQVFHLQVGDRQFELQTLGDAVARLEEGWYCPTFGLRQRVQVIAWGGQFTLPKPLGWVLKWPGQQGTVSLTTNHDPNDEGKPIVDWHDPERHAQWRLYRNDA